jgi:hypothetical protein
MQHMKNFGSFLSRPELTRKYIEANRMKVFKTGLVLTVIRILLFAFLYGVTLRYGKTNPFKNVFADLQLGIILVQIIVVVLILIIKKPWYTEWSINIWLIL